MFYWNQKKLVSIEYHIIYKISYKLYVSNKVRDAICYFCTGKWAKRVDKLIVNELASKVLKNNYILASKCVVTITLRKEQCIKQSLHFSIRTRNLSQKL